MNFEVYIGSGIEGRNGNVQSLCHRSQAVSQQLLSSAFLYWALDSHSVVFQFTRVHLSFGLFRQVQADLSCVLVFWREGSLPV